ncbi:MAG: pyrimidine dimer DNA glycosylase/endonuclease V [Burkholderiales bacterium]
MRFLRVLVTSVRIWSLHPKYLDPQGLVALWREALLAQAVLRGETQGYRHHPQLNRFRSQRAPVCAIAAYLSALHHEASRRNYSFDKSKIGRVRRRVIIPVTSGQIEYEWKHLLEKLALRSPATYARLRAEESPQCHPLFRPCPGSIENWERGSLHEPQKFGISALSFDGYTILN